LALSSLLSSCSPLSKEGPSASDIKQNASYKVGSETSPSVYEYVLVDLDSKAIKVFGKSQYGSLYGTFGSRRSTPSNIILGVGDTVQVTIFESQAGGLFVPDDAGARPGNFVTLPPQQIDANGTLNIPYAGSTKFAGRTIADVQQDIAKRLANRAIEPQVLITMQSQRSSQVSVVGDVRSPARIDINPAGDRIVDVIARTGGPSFPGYETYVTLERRQRKSTVNFEDIIADARENIYVHPNDTVYVYREPARFLAFGAVNSVFVEKSNLVEFNQRYLTLAEGLGRVGGINDSRGDAKKVFLYRFVDRRKLLEANFDLRKFPIERETIPVIFQIDFSDPAGYFAAQNFYLSNRDILYVDNSGTYDASKFLSFVTQSSQTITSVNNSVVSTKAAKDAVKNW